MNNSHSKLGANLADLAIQTVIKTDGLDEFILTMKILPPDSLIESAFLGQLVELAIKGMESEK